MNVLDEHDRAALRLNRAMQAFIAKQEPLGAEFEAVLVNNLPALYSRDGGPAFALCNDHDEASDRIKADEQSAESALRLAWRLGKFPLLIATVAAAWGAATYFDTWPWLVAKLAF